MESLEVQLEAWHRKSSLRFLYGEWYREIGTWLAPGTTCEIGCGIGRLKNYLPNIIGMDIVKTPWADIVGDAQILPIKNETIVNLILFDVLHHLPRPSLLFQEALRVLQSGGRLIISDPYISPFSRFVYNNFHLEPVNFDCDPLNKNFSIVSEQPFDANQAVASILFFRKLETWQEMFPEFSIKTLKRHAFFAYPATGGFGSRTFLPHKAICLTQHMEKLFSPLAGLLAFRLMVVLEKAIE